MNITDSFALFQFLWLAVYENRRKAISGSSYYMYIGVCQLFPLDYTLYLIFRELAIVGDIYRGQHEFHTQPWLSVTYTINPT